MEIRREIYNLIKDDNREKIIVFSKTERGMFFIDKFYLQIIEECIKHNYNNVIIELYKIVVPTFKKEIFKILLQTKGLEDLLLLLYNIYKIPITENLFFSNDIDLIIKIFYDDIPLQHVFEYISHQNLSSEQGCQLILRFRSKIINNFNCCCENQYFVKNYLIHLINYCLSNDTELLVQIYYSNCNTIIKNYMFERILSSERKDKLDILNQFVKHYKPPYHFDFIKNCILGDDLKWLLQQYHDQIRPSDFISYCENYGSLIDENIIEMFMEQLRFNFKYIQKLFNVFCRCNNIDCARFIENINHTVYLTIDTLQEMISDKERINYQKIFLWLIGINKISSQTLFQIIINSHDPIQFIKKQIEVNEQVLCPICLEETNTEQLHFIKLDCECKDKQYIHMECLCQWLKTKNKNECLYCYKPIDWHKCCRIIL